MSLVTSGVIGFANTTPQLLIEALREYEKAADCEIVDCHNLNDMVEATNGTRGPDFVVIAGGFNYWHPDKIDSMCKWLWLNKKITSIGALKYEHTDGQVHVISNDWWNDII